MDDGFLGGKVGQGWDSASLRGAPLVESLGFLKFNTRWIIFGFSGLAIWYKSWFAL